MDNPTKSNSKYSILSDAGENYHYAKTIINNKIEIIKLELLQHISDISKILLVIVLALFFGIIITTLLIATIVVFLAGVLDSYTYALLAVTGVMATIFIITFSVLKPIIAKAIEKKLMNLTSNKTSNA